MLFILKFGEMRGGTIRAYAKPLKASRIADQLVMNVVDALDFCIIPQVAVTRLAFKY